MLSPVLAGFVLCALACASAQSAYANDEIIVTGTHTNGIRSASPTISIGKSDIERSGYTTLQQALQALPQNFSGGASGVTGGGLSTNNDSFTQTQGPNIRGLGGGSTLLLLNGHRLPPIEFGNIFDLGAFPVSAIERVDVMTDGASAIYGSDAVGGVVNILLREDFSGSESRVRLGSGPSGDSHEQQVSHAFGREWDAGNVFASVEVYRRTALSSSARPYAADAPDPSDLLPQRKQRSFLISVRHGIAGRTTLSAHALCSERSFDSSIGGALELSVNTRQSGGAGQCSASLAALSESASAWKTQVSTSYARSRSFNLTTRLPELKALGHTETRFGVSALEVKSERKLWTGRGGDGRVVLGAQYRNERYLSRRVPSHSGEQRDISAVFAELGVPIASARLSLAARHERYSDFGSSTHPKLGLLWSPLASMTFRSTYGTSFKAPTSDQLDPSSDAYFVFSVSDRHACLLTGQNADLRPERAKTWTAGLDIRSPDAEHWAAHITYFDIGIRDGITVPLLRGTIPGFVQAGAIPRYVVRDPTEEQLERWVASDRFFNPSSVDLAGVDVLIDNRLHNLATTRVNGIDLLFSTEHFLRTAKLHFTLNASHLLHHQRRLLPDDGFKSVVSTPFNPVRFRARASLGWTRGGAGTTVFVDFVGAYRDTRLNPAAKVGSWTTLDGNLFFDTQEHGKALGLDDVVISLNANNLMNQRPPFLNGFGVGASFDGANANPVGRFLSIQFTKRWRR